MLIRNKKKIQAGQESFLVRKTSRPPVEPTQPPGLCLDEALSPAVEWRECDSASSAEVKYEWS